MKKIQSGLKVNLNKIKRLENSRLRLKEENVADLVDDMKERGQMQAIGVRASDYGLIYGYRRFRAAQILDWKSIEVDLYDDVTDEDILVMNINENIRRANVSPLEIGKILEMFKAKGYKNMEIAAKFGLSEGQVKRYISAWNLTGGTKYESLVKENLRGNASGMSAGVLYSIFNSLGGVNKGKISETERNLILDAVLDKRITTNNRATFANLIKGGMKITEAIEKLDDVEAITLHFVFNKRAASVALRKANTDSKTQLVREILQKEFPNLLA